MNDNEIGMIIRPQGYFTISTDKRGKLAEFPNLITNSGLDLLVVTGFMSKCFVGTGSVAPTVDDVQMTTFRAESSEIFSSVYGCATSAPYYAFLRNTYRFAAGSASGNLSEVGIGKSVSGTRSLFSRELIKDSFGNPTTITLLSDEVLEVVYELRHYIPDTDVTGSITFTGNLAGTYAYTIRPMAVTNSSAWNTQNRGYSTGEPSTAAAYASSIGSITSSPVGNPYNSDGVVISNYISGTYSIQLTYKWSLSNGNVPGGIRSVGFIMGIGSYQIEFNPPIPKTNMDTLKLTFGYSWARKP